MEWPAVERKVLGPVFSSESTTDTQNKFQVKTVYFRIDQSPFAATYILYWAEIPSCNAHQSYGHVDAEFRDNMTKEEAQQFVRKAISHAMARDGSSGGVIRMVVIDKTGVSRMTTSQTPHRTSHPSEIQYAMPGSGRPPVLCNTPKYIFLLPAPFVARFCSELRVSVSKE